MGLELIEIIWKFLRNLNGQIRSYEFRRDGVIVYIGLEIYYYDFIFILGVEYGYIVIVNNS